MDKLDEKYESKFHHLICLGNNAGPDMFIESASYEFWVNIEGLGIVNTKVTPDEFEVLSGIVKRLITKKVVDELHTCECGGKDFENRLEVCPDGELVTVDRCIKCN